jgi:hypothetical protein
MNSDNSDIQTSKSILTLSALLAEWIISPYVDQNCNEYALLKIVSIKEQNFFLKKSSHYIYVK